MKSKPKFLIVLLGAIITIGILVATVGKPPFAKHYPQFGHCENTKTTATEQK